MHLNLPHDLGSHRLDHVAVAVENLEEASAPYLQLGLAIESDEVVPEQQVRVRMLSLGEGRLELLEPTSPDSGVAKFLRNRGSGLHHIALRVGGLDDEVARLKVAGARFTSDEPGPGHGGTRVIFLHPKWTGGVLVELLEGPTEGHV